MGLSEIAKVVETVDAAEIGRFQPDLRAGISVNATVCFTLTQSVVVAEAVERGLARREEGGGSTESSAGLPTARPEPEDERPD